MRKWQRIGPPLNSAKCYSVTTEPDNPDTIYIACRPHGVFKSIDGGTNWNHCGGNIPASASIGANPHSLRINPHCPGEVWLGIERHGVFKSSDSGATWTNLQRGLSGRALNGICFGFAGGDAATIYYGSDLGIYKSQDGGGHWSPLSNGLPNGLPRLESNGQFIPSTTVSEILVDELNPETIYAGFLFTNPKDPCGVYKSSDGGASWRPLIEGLPRPPESHMDGSTTDPRGVRSLVRHPVQSGVLFACLQNRGIYKLPARGDVWQLVSDTFPAVVTALSIHPLHPGQIFAGLKNGGVYHSGDAGQNWTPLSDGLKVGERSFPREYTLKDTDGSSKTLTGYLYESTIYELHCNLQCPGILYAATADGLFAIDTNGHVEHKSD